MDSHTARPRFRHKDSFRARIKDSHMAKQETDTWTVIQPNPKLDTRTVFGPESKTDAKTVPWLNKRQTHGQHPL